MLYQDRVVEPNFSREDLGLFLDALDGRMVNAGFREHDRTKFVTDGEGYVWVTGGDRNTTADDWQPWQDLPNSEVVDNVLEMMRVIGNLSLGFRVRMNGVYLADGDAQICRFYFPLSGGIGTGGTTQNLEEAFNQLAERWERETALHSNPDLIMAHPAFQQIVDIGTEALPFIFRRMERGIGHWYHPLEVMVNENPVPEEFKGDVERTDSAWLEWGRNKGYLT